MCLCLWVLCFFVVAAFQGEKLRNLILSEAADWQVLTLTLAVHLQALDKSLHGDDSHGDTGKTSEQVA